jgi:hypothetical protein
VAVWKPVEMAKMKNIEKNTCCTEITKTERVAGKGALVENIECQ